MVVDSATAPPAAAAAPPFTGWLRWFALTALAVLVLDLTTKALFFGTLAGADLPRWIRLAYNPGVAWSMFAEHPWLVVGLTALLIPLLTAVWWRQYRLSGRWENLAFGLILGGAVGNAWDRLLMHLGRLEGVRDFIHVDLGFWPLNPWPTFNIADSGICIGFAIVLLLSFRKPA